MIGGTSVGVSDVSFLSRFSDVSRGERCARIGGGGSDCTVGKERGEVKK